MTHHTALRQRLTAAATAGGTLAATLGLLLGMPYILWQASGIPWPELGDRLAQPLSDPLLVDLLAMAGWLCWAAFTWTVIRECCWYATHLPQLLRDRAAHDEHMAALSVKGSLAALCVGTLVIGLLGLWRPQTVSAHEPSSMSQLRPHAAAAAPLEPAASRHAAASAARPPHAEAPGLGGSQHTEPSARTAAEPGAARHIEYTVVDGDTLWDIADAHLNDPCKWPRIYALNKDRLQSDGHRLSDPDLIRPGWQLTIPVARTEAPPPPQPAPEPAAPAQPSAPPTETPAEQPKQEDTVAPGQDADDEAASSAPNHQTSTPPHSDTATGPAAIGLGHAGLIGITAAAGFLAARRYWYVHQHRRRRPDLNAELPTLSPVIDKAAQAAHAATQPRHPHDPDALITRCAPPQPPCSASTVTIGEQDNVEVSLEALARPGGCHWTGPGAEAAARALLTGILTAAERQRPGPARVKAVVTEDMAERLLPGLPPTFSALTQSADTAHAVQVAEQHLIAHAHHQQDSDLSEIEHPAQGSSTQAADPGTMLLLTVPDAVHTGRLQALAARSRPDTLIVLTLEAALPDADPWNIATDGTTTHRHAPGSSRLQLFHLTPEAGRDMTEVFLGAHGQRPHLRILPTPGPPPRPRETNPVDEAEAEPPPEPPRPADASLPAQTKPIRLHVLGPITLYARGNPDPIGTNLRPEVHEFLALLAAHSTGLLATDIADKLRLDGANDQNALKNLRRAVRRALRAATGITAQEFILRQGELHKLHPELVETDLADFQHSLKSLSKSGAGEPPSGDLPAVREALAHYRGPFAQGRDYPWADATREHLAIKATDAVLRIAHRAEHTDTPLGESDAILSLLEHLGAIHPDHERLAQHAIRLYQATGRHDAARHTFTRLQRLLAELGLEPEPATQALVTPKAGSRRIR